MVCGRLRTGDDSGLIATGHATPRLSWVLSSARPAVRQIAYEVQVASDRDFAVEVVSSGHIPSDTVVDHSWPAEPLRSRQVRFWRVRARTDQGWTGWSDAARVEGALFSAGDWQARPVYVPSDRGRTTSGPVPLLRRAFSLPAQVISARLYVTALGVHRTFLNGAPVGEEILAPGWTSYPTRLLYSSYDCTALLRAGQNVLSAEVGDGWYRGTLTWSRTRNFYGEASALLAQLEVTLSDGSTVVVGTDERWRGGYGARRMADIYDGCDIDFRQEPEGWRTPDFDDDGWEPVAQLELPRGLTHRAHPPVRVLDEFAPVCTPSDDGRIRIDAGQNLTGWLRLLVTGPRGATVRVRHAEIVDADGRLFTSVLRSARAADTYVLAGGATVLEPSFTYHGFRHAEIEVPPNTTVDDVQVVVVASDLRRIGEFACSDPQVNQLYSNVVWSQRGNFLAVPTDCPQRDERLGWTGDLMAFAATAVTNFDCRSFLDSWLTDVRAEQRATGSIPLVVPDCVTTHPPLPPHLKVAECVAGWGDAAVVVPAALHRAYGAGSSLAQHYLLMQGLVEYVAGLLADDGTWSGYAQIGDHLAPDAPQLPHGSTTDPDLVASAFFVHSVELLADTADELGRNLDARRYRDLRNRVAHGTWCRWRDELRRTQTGCALALEFRVVPDEERPAIGAALAELVRRNHGRIATGFLGTPFVLPALTATGHDAEAYVALLNEECPGWLYEVGQGATTIWENWDAIRPDGSINLGSGGLGDIMSSFNHYALGAVAAWFYQSVAGIRSGSPGYRHIVFAPRPGGGLTFARAAIHTPYGRASIEWHQADCTLDVTLEIPPGATGELVAPPGWKTDRPTMPSGAHRIALATSESSPSRA